MSVCPSTGRVEPADFVLVIKANTVMLQANIFFHFTDITYVPVSPSTGRVEPGAIVSAIKANTVMLQANILSFTDITYVPVCQALVGLNQLIL